MTVDEFNDKYEKYLQKGHYGLDINNEKVIEYLDNKFQEFIKIPNFTYAQIKLKWNYARFYADGISSEVCKEVEQDIIKILNTK